MRTRAALALLTLVGGCLITREPEIAAIDSPPELALLRPGRVSQVPAQTELSCESGLDFEVALVDVDVQQQHWVQLYVNGQALLGGAALPKWPLPPSAGGAKVSWCVPRTLLSAEPCSLVEVFATSVPDKLTNTAPARVYDPEVVRVEWIVLAPGEAFLNVAPGDCIRRYELDGGTS